jgi:ABC-type lipoprotein export system ATPase subunit
MTDIAIKTHDLKKSYRTGRVRQQVLYGIDFEVERGELISIVGKSGSGKSTLLNVIGGLDRRFEGKVEVEGQRLDGLSDRNLSRFRNETIGFVFQQFHLLEHLSLVENVSAPAIFARKSESARTIHERAEEALAKVGLDGREKDLAANLSGGQKQRVAIARALFNEPRVLLCDEPTGNLDTVTGEQIVKLFVDLNQNDGITLVIVTHEQRVSLASHRVIHMKDGKIENGVGDEGKA